MMQAIAATDHAKQRLRDRYGVNPSTETVVDHLALILAGESFRVGPQGGGRVLHLVGYEGRQFLVIYCPRARKIITYLPRSHMPTRRF